MCKYYRELEVFNMFWILKADKQEWKEFHYEIGLDDFYYLLQDNEYDIKELRLHRMKESDTCSHKICNDIGA